MKVLFYSWEFPPHGTGVGSYVAGMARALSLQGHQCLVVTGRVPGGPEVEETEAGRVFRVYGEAERGSREAARSVLEIARKEGVDVIEGADHYGECAPLLAIPDRPPVVLRVHSSLPIRVARESDILYPWQRPLITASVALAWRQYRNELAVLKGCRHGTVPSRRLKDELVRQGFHAADGWEVIPNSVERFDAQRKEAEVPTLLFVGRVSIGKGIQYLPDILSRVSRTVPGVQLEIIGGDSYARGLGSLTEWLKKQLGPLNDHVKFLGQCSREDVDAAYRRAWVLLAPSRWDNFPFSVLEAMARGLPVMASPHGGMPEMLEGTLCETMDPASEEFVEGVAEYLQDEGRRRQAGATLQERARSVYTPARVADQYSRFLESVIREA